MGVEECARHVRAAFDQHALDRALGQLPEHAVGVAPVARPDNLYAARREGFEAGGVRAFCCKEYDGSFARRLGQARVRGETKGRVQDYACEGKAARQSRAISEQRVIGQGRPRADQNSIVFVTQEVSARARLFTGNPARVARARGDSPVQ